MNYAASSNVRLTLLVDVRLILVVDVWLTLLVHVRFNYVG